MNSEQLRLELGMPWSGLSPRLLTRAHARFSLASEGTGRSNPEPIAMLKVVQLELFPEGTSYGT